MNRPRKILRLPKRPPRRAALTRNSRNGGELNQFVGLGSQRTSLVERGALPFDTNTLSTAPAAFPAVAGGCRAGRRGASRGGSKRGGSRASWGRRRRACP